MTTTLARTLLCFLSQKEEWPVERRERLRSAFDPVELREIATETRPFLHPLARHAASMLDEEAERARIAELISRGSDAGAA